MMALVKSLPGLQFNNGFQLLPYNAEQWLVRAWTFFPCRYVPWYSAPRHLSHAHTANVLLSAWAYWPFGLCISQWTLLESASSLLLCFLASLSWSFRTQYSFTSSGKTSQPTCQIRCLTSVGPQLLMCPLCCHNPLPASSSSPSLSCLLPSSSSSPLSYSVPPAGPSFPPGKNWN